MGIHDERTLRHAAGRGVQQGSPRRFAICTVVSSLTGTAQVTENGTDHIAAYIPMLQSGAGYMALSAGNVVAVEFVDGLAYIIHRYS